MTPFTHSGERYQSAMGYLNIKESYRPKSKNENRKKESQQARSNSFDGRESMLDQKSMSFESKSDTQLSVDSDFMKSNRIAIGPFTMRNGEADNLATQDSFEGDLVFDKINAMHD